MSFFKRFVAPNESAPIDNASQLDGAALADGAQPTLPSPEHFVAAQAEMLKTSRNSWRNTANSLSSFHEDNFYASILTGVGSQFKQAAGASDTEPDSEVIKSVTETLLNDLSVMWLVGARGATIFAESENTKGLKQDIKLKRRLIGGVSDPAVGRVLNSISNTQATGLTYTFTKIETRIASADTCSRKTLENFVDTFGDSTEAVHEFVDLYEDGVSDIDPDFEELQKMIATDWHHFDPEKSVLRNFLRRFASQPERHLDAFSREVATDRSNHAIGRLRTMAAFAIISNGTDEVTEEAIQKRVKDSYGRWDDIKDIESIDAIFTRFVAARVATMESALNLIAGKPDAQNIRAHRPASAIAQYYASVRMQLPETRQERRSASKKRNVTSIGSLPTFASITEEAASTQKLQESRDLSAVQILPGGNMNITALSPETVAEYFELPGDNGLPGDVIKIVSYLRDTQRTGMYGLKHLHQSIKIGGVTRKMWRFAPDDCPGLEVNPKNRYYRLVCIFEKDKLRILDILDHDKFTKKYS